jgi:ribosome-associated protein
MATPETRRQLLAAVAACEDKKGEDTRILELDPSDSGLADFFLITSASNDRQVVAIADEIEFRLKKDFGLYATSVEGRRQAEWILLDYVDIVIHVFLAEKRAFYDIERLRKSARNLTGPDIEREVEVELRSALARKTRAVRSSSAPVPTGPAKLNPSPTQKPSKGDSTVSAKPAKKAAKKAAKKVAAKQAVKKTAKKAAKPATRSVAVASKKPAKKLSAVPAKKAAPVKKSPAKAAKAAPVADKVLAPPILAAAEAPPEASSTGNVISSQPIKRSTNKPF